MCGRTGGREERAVENERLREVDAKLPARFHRIDVDGVVGDEVEACPDGKRVRGGRLGEGEGRGDAERRDQDGSGALQFGQDAFFSAAAAASAAAFFPCSIRALTFWPPFWPISS